LNETKKRTETFYRESEPWSKLVVRASIKSIGYVKDVLKEEVLPGLDVAEWIAWYVNNHGPYTDDQDFIDEEMFEYVDMMSAEEMIEVNGEIEPDLEDQTSEKPRCPKCNMWFQSPTWTSDGMLLHVDNCSTDYC